MGLAGDNRTNYYQSGSIALKKILNIKYYGRKVTWL